MNMKKKIALLLGFVLMASLTGCGTSKDSSVATVPIVENNTTEASTTEITTETTEEFTTEEVTTEAPTTEPVTEAMNNNVEFDSYKYNFSDKNGYNYEVTLKVSEWIKVSDKDRMNYAWSSVKGDPAKLPQNANDWGIVKWQGTSTYGRGQNGNYEPLYTSYDGMTDYYYAIGTVHIKNITDGWHITDSNQATPRLLLSTAGYTMEGDLGKGFIIKTFYSTKTETQNILTYVKPAMKSDSWGPMKFIICHPENVTPAHPDGQYKNRVINQVFGIAGGSDVLRNAVGENNPDCLTFKIKYNY